jgi:hypothetical protein
LKDGSQPREDLDSREVVRSNGWVERLSAIKRPPGMGPLRACREIQEVSRRQSRDTDTDGNTSLARVLGDTGTGDGIGVEQFAIFLIGVAMMAVGALILTGGLSTGGLLALGGAAVVVLLVLSLARFGFETDATMRRRFRTERGTRFEDRFRAALCEKGGQ